MLPYRGEEMSQENTVNSNFKKTSLVLNPMIKMLAHITLLSFPLFMNESRQSLEIVFLTICISARLMGYLKTLHVKKKLQNLKRVTTLSFLFSSQTWKYKNYLTYNTN